MKRVLWAIIAVLALARIAAAQTFPDHYDNYVNDFANLLTPAQEAELQALMKPLREAQGIEFTIVTIDRMSDYGHRGEIEPYATALFNRWGVGNAQRNDGVMMLVARSDRQMRIEVGSGYGAATKRTMQRIIDNDILPHFRRDDYGGGIVAGARKVVADLTGSAIAAPFVGGSEESSWWDRITEKFGAWLAAFAAIIGAALIKLRIAIHRARPRICPNDGNRMPRLDEVADNALLNVGQQTEERLKSVNYDVYHCNDCGHTIIEGWSNWFSWEKVCPSCGYRTLQSYSITVRDATTSSTGLKEIHYNCVNCQHRYSETRTMPELSESSSSDSSFGGGSSSGGGASGRW